MTASKPAEPEYMTREEVRAAFQVSSATVSRWGRAGKLTSVRTLGGHRRYLTAEVRGLLAGTGSGPARTEAGAAEVAEAIARAIEKSVCEPGEQCAERFCPDCTRYAQAQADAALARSAGAGYALQSGSPS